MRIAFSLGVAVAVGVVRNSALESAVLDAQSVVDARGAVRNSAVEAAAAPGAAGSDAAGAILAWAARLLEGIPDDGAFFRLRSSTSNTKCTNCRMDFELHSDILQR